MLGGTHNEHSEQIHTLLASASTFTGHLEMLHGSFSESAERLRVPCQLDPTGRYAMSVIVLGWVRWTDGPHSWCSSPQTMLFFNTSSFADGKNTGAVTAMPGLKNDDARSPRPARTSCYR